MVEYNYVIDFEGPVQLDSRFKKRRGIAAPVEKENKEEDSWSDIFKGVLSGYIGGTEEAQELLSPSYTPSMEKDPFLDQQLELLKSVNIPKEDRTREVFPEVVGGFTEEGLKREVEKLLDDTEQTPIDVDAPTTSSDTVSDTISIGEREAEIPAKKVTEGLMSSPRPKPRPTEQGSELFINVKEPEKVFGWKGRDGPTKKQQEAFDLLKDKAIEEGIIGTELRQLLAQAAVESEWYTKTIERSGGSSSNISGGSAYLGRGPLQITHDYNYKEFGEFKGEGDKYLKNPELLKDPKLGVEAALWYWSTKVKPNVDDFSNTFAVSGAINRGDVTLKASHLDWREEAFNNIEIK